MCGITLSIYPVSPTTGPDPETIALHESLASSNANRGPDTSDTWTHVVDVDDGKQVEIRLTSSVLGLRGELTGQPIRGTRGVLAWNGQVSILVNAEQSGWCMDKEDAFLVTCRVLRVYGYAKVYEALLRQHSMCLPTKL